MPYAPWPKYTVFRYCRRMKSFPYSSSRRVAYQSSSSFRLAVCSTFSMMASFTYCWVMVDPPWLIPPASRLERAARMIAFRSKPSCS